MPWIVETLQVPSVSYLKASLLHGITQQLLENGYTAVTDNTPGLKVGGYLNTCICMESHSSPTHYEQDVEWFTSVGFDSVKIDNCGSSQNVTQYAELFNKTGKAIQIENCHNQFGPDLQTGACPMNFYRSGGDIHPGLEDVVGKIYSTVLFNDRPVPASYPGCWAYPDMSEVGNWDPSPTRYDEEQAHWGLWAIVSSPMVLGFDMSDGKTLDRVWPIITNTEVLAVNQDWAGHPGTLVKTYRAEGARLMVQQGDCDGSPSTLGWRLADGRLRAPRGPGGGEAQCLTLDHGDLCPPVTLHDTATQCGNFLGTCKTAHLANLTLAREYARRLGSHNGSFRGYPDKGGGAVFS